MPARSALDRAFPSFALLAAALLSAIALIALLGWKIFSLESEKAEIERERLLLERDRDAFLTYGGELPQMTERHRRLTVEVSELEGRGKALAETEENLRGQCEELGRKAARLTGAVAEMETRLQSLETEAAAERATIARLRPEQEAARSEVAELKAQAGNLRDSVAQKQKQEASLTASLESLERSVAHNRELLGRMSADNEAYDRFEKQLSAIGARFDGLIDRVASQANDFGTRLDGVEKFVARMEQSLTLIDADRESLSHNLDAMKKDRAAWSALLRQNGEQNHSLRTQVETIAANSRKFQSVMETVRSLDDRLQAALSAETASLRKMALEDSQTRESLNQSAQTLGHVSAALKEGLEAMQESAGKIAALLASQREEFQAVSGKSEDLGAAAVRIETIGKSATESAAKLVQISDGLIAQIRSIEARLNGDAERLLSLDKAISGQEERIKEFTSLARSLANEIDDNRRRSSTLEVLLKEIQALLDARRDGGEAQ